MMYTGTYTKLSCSSPDDESKSRETSILNSKLLLLQCDILVAIPLLACATTDSNCGMS